MFPPTRMPRGNQVNEDHAVKLPKCWPYGMVHNCTAQIQLTNRILLEVQSFERGLVQLLCIKKRSVSMQ